MPNHVYVPGLKQNYLQKIHKSYEMALQIHKVTLFLAMVEKAINGRADGYGFRMT